MCNSKNLAPDTGWGYGVIMKNFKDIFTKQYSMSCKLEYTDVTGHKMDTDIH